MIGCPYLSRYVAYVDFGHSARHAGRDTTDGQRLRKANTVYGGFFQSVSLRVDSYRPGTRRQRNRVYVAAARLAATVHVLTGRKPVFPHSRIRVHHIDVVKKTSIYLIFLHTHTHTSIRTIQLGGPRRVQSVKTNVLVSRHAGVFFIKSAQNCAYKSQQNTQ